MRQFILLLTMFITLTCSAHHITALGWCSNGKAYFMTEAFDNNLDVQIELVQQGPNELVKSFTTPAVGATVVIFNVNQPVRTTTITIRFRYKVHNSSNWSSWSGNVISKTTFFNGCNTLPMRIGTPKAMWTGTSSIDVLFDVYELSGSNTLEFSLSGKGVSYAPAKIVLPITSSAGAYIASLAYSDGSWKVINLKNTTL
jgi:hypothetical protein